MYCKKSEGFALAGTLVALVISLVAVGIGMTINERYQIMQRTNNAIKMQVSQVSVFFRAVNQYVEENASGWALDGRVPIEVSTLIADGLLPADWNAVTQFKTELRAVGSKINDPGNPGEPANVFVIYEAQSSSQDTYSQMMGLFGYESTAEVEALKRRIGKAYYDKDMLGGLVKAGTSNMHGISNRYTKSLAGYLTVDGVVPQVVAVKGFPDLAEYEPEMSETPGGSGGPGIGGNDVHGKIQFDQPGDYEWTVPKGVNYLKVILAGGGVYQAGGGLSVGSMVIKENSKLLLQVGEGAVDGINDGSFGSGRTAIIKTGIDGIKTVLVVVGGAGGWSRNYSSTFGGTPGPGGSCKDTGSNNNAVAPMGAGTGTEWFLNGTTEHCNVWVPMPELLDYCYPSSFPVADTYKTAQQGTRGGYADLNGGTGEDGVTTFMNTNSFLGSGGGGGGIDTQDPTSGDGRGGDGSVRIPLKRYCKDGTEVTINITGQTVSKTLYGGGGASEARLKNYDIQKHASCVLSYAIVQLDNGGGGGGGYHGGNAGSVEDNNGTAVVTGGAGGSGYCPGITTTLDAPGGNEKRNKAWEYKGAHGFIEFVW